MPSQGKPAKDIKVVLVELKPLQWKFDFQINKFEAFKKLLEKRQVKHTKIFVKNVFTKEAWQIMYVKLEMWMP
jgi:hypothetical protein